MIRRCDVCQKILSENNPSNDKCFYHDLPEKEQKKLDERPHGGPLCSSVVKTGFNLVTIEYHGGPKDL